jgi:tetratricopeptide (TPR) repeat protein
MTFTSAGLSRIARLFWRSNSRQDDDVPAPSSAPDITVAPVWEDTNFAPVLSEISSQSSGWSADQLLAGAAGELSNAKAAHLRYSPVSSLRHLYRALAYRTLAHAGETAELIGNIGWQLSEIGDYRKARDIGCFAYELRAQTGAEPEALAVSAVKLAVYNFYLGDLNESREWLQRVPPSERNAEYSSFEKKVRLCEEASDALKATESPIGNVDSLVSSAKTSISKGRLKKALSLLHQALAIAESSNDHKRIYQCHLGVADVLYENYRFYLESALWYLKAFRSAVKSRWFDKAAEVLLRAGQARLETGDFIATAALLKQGLADLNGSCSGISRSRVLALLSFSIASTEVQQAAEYLTAAAWELNNVATEEVLEWSLAFGRLFVRREQFELAAKCLNVGFQRVVEGTYYSARAGSLFQELAHIYYMQQKWTSCLMLINEGRNRSYLNHDLQGVCSGLVHAARVYRDVDERELAEKTIRTAIAIGNELDHISIGHELQTLTQEVMFGPAALRSQGSLSHSVLVVLRELPGSDPFNSALASLRTMVTEIESLSQQDEIDKFESDAFRFPFTMRAYGTGLDRAGRQREARDYLARAFRIHKGFKDYPEAATAIHEYAVASARLGLYFTAKRAFLVALTYKGRYGSTTNRLTDSLLGYVKASIVLGNVEGLAARLRDLEREAKSALSYWKGSESLTELSVLLNVADGYLLLREVGEAERIIAQAESVLTNEPTQASTLELAHLSTIELKLGRSDEAFHHAKQAMGLIEEGRPEIVGPNRREWQRYGTVVAAAIINAAYKIGISQAEEALRATELVKVRSLLEQFGRAHIPAPAGLPEEFRIKDDELRKSSLDVLLKLQSASEEERDELLTELAGIERTEHVLLRGIPPGFEEYAKLRRGSALDPSEVITRHLPSAQTEFLAMFPLEDGVFEWHFDVQGKCKDWRRVELSKSEIQRAVASIQADVSRLQWNANILDHVAQELLGDFISSIQADTNLCLVLGGPLLQVPFAAARIGTAYIAERYPLAVLPSFSVAGYWNPTADTPAKTGLVLADSLGDLPYARKEASTVAALFACEQLKGKNITREKILLGLPQCDLVHIACHAQYDSSDPLSSAILLSGKKQFTCRDLMTLSSRAKFAFLSACESGRITIHAGDELEGLAPSFMYSGFETVVGSLWKVPDRQTRELVEVFYDHAQKGTHLARCLQLAQMAVLRSKTSASPYFWGAWQIVGNWRVRLN